MAVVQTQTIQEEPEARIAFSESNLIASICRKSFYEFVKEFWSVACTETPIWNWHIKYLCDEFQKAAELVFQNKPREYDMVINVSPGSTKSIIFSIMAPAWIWTRMKHAVIITGSYGNTLALKLSLKSRDILKSEKYQQCFPEIVLRKDQDTKSLYMNKSKGEKITCTVGGGIVGSHGNFILIDDPLNPKEASSELELAAANNWMAYTLPARKKDLSVCLTVLIMQRLHQDDCSGSMIERIKTAQRTSIREHAEDTNLKLKHICLPAELTDNIKPKSLSKYYKNGLMNPIRHSKSVLLEKQSAGEYSYAGQFLQNPIPAGGGMFKTERITIDVPPTKWLQKIRFWDKAGTAGGTGAYTVGLLMGIDREKRFWILDVIRGRWDSAAREKIIKQTAIIDGREVKIGIEQEPGSGGKESAENTVKNLAGFRVTVDKPSGSHSSKVERADPYSSQVNGNNVSMKEAEWNKEYIDELAFFPLGKYKDQVDGSSGAFNKLNARKKRIGVL